MINLGQKRNFPTCFFKIEIHFFHPEMILFSPRKYTPAGNFKKPKNIMWIWETMLRNAISLRVFLKSRCFFKNLDIWKTTLQKSLPKKHVSRTRNFEPSKLTLDRDFPSSRWVNALLNRTCSIVSPYPERLKRPSKLLLKNDASEKSLWK